MNRKEFALFVVIAIVVALVLLFFGFNYIWGGNPLNSGCPDTETIESMPFYAKSATFKFESPALYVIPKGPEHCSPTALSINGSIDTPDSDTLDAAKYGYIVSPVDKNTEFKMVKHVYVQCHGFSCTGAGPGDYIILQDGQGNLWRWSAILSSKQNQLYFTVGYYINGQRIDSVKLSDILLSAYP